MSPETPGGGIPDPAARVEMLLEVGRVADAVAEARRLAAQNPRDTAILVALSRSLLTAGDLDEAEDVAQAALASDPLDVAASVVAVRTAIAMARRRPQARRAARDWAGTAVKRAERLRPYVPTEPQIAYLVSRACAAGGDRHRAVEAAGEASRAGPDSIWGPLAFAELERDRWRHRAARRHLAEALRRDPGHAYVQRVGATIAGEPAARVGHLRAAARAGDRAAGHEASNVLVQLSRPHASVWPAVLVAVALLAFCGLTTGPWWLYLTGLVMGWLALWTTSLRLRARLLRELPPSARGLIIRPAARGVVGGLIACAAMVGLGVGMGWPPTYDAAVAHADALADRAARRSEPIPTVVVDPSGVPRITHVRERPEPNIAAAYETRAYLIGAAVVFLVVAAVTGGDAVRLRRRVVPRDDRERKE